MTTALIPHLPPDPAARVRPRMRDLQSLTNPAWRHARATALVERKVQHFRRSEDADVQRLVSFLRAYRGPDEDAKEDAIDQYADVYWAFMIHREETRGPRQFLEAMVLADADQETIADYLGIPVDVVDTYERLFFDLRDLIQHSQAIRAYLISRTRKRGLGDLDPDSLWKLIGMADGLDALYSIWGSGRMVSSERGRIDELIASQMRRNTLDAQFVRAPTHYNANDITLEYLQLRRLELDETRSLGGVGAGDVDTAGLVAALVHAIQFTTAPVGREADAAYIEVSSAVSQAPAILARLQGTTRKEDVEHGKSEQRSADVDDAGDPDADDIDIDD